jgi:hypothetical protein
MPGAMSETLFKPGGAYVNTKFLYLKTCTVQIARVSSHRGSDLSAKL